MADDDDGNSEDRIAWEAGLPPTIAATLTKAGLRPTSNAVQLLRATAQLAVFKEADRDVLSASGLLLAAVELNRSSSDGDDDPELTALALVRAAFLGANDQRAQDLRSLAMSDFYAAEPKSWRDTPPPAEMRFSDGMKLKIEEFRGRGRLDVIDLIGA